ncbi:glycosyltransferase [Myxococcus faecalis]|uniref:glycosyltransferase n=1 Tax=Myxococcus faecalis TaxID=3115646 RepID=UPI0038D0D9FD
MRICAVMKYPPIQGGVSAQSYWMARGLAEAGHEVHVVTNADEVEPEHRIIFDEDDREWLAPAFGQGRVHLHGTEPLSPTLTHIPQSNPFTGKLAGSAAEVVRRYGCDLIYSYYLEPYGVAAHLAASWTGVPYLVRNAGSDVGRLMNHLGLATTYREVLRRADGICSGSPYPYLGMGVRPEALYRGPPSHLPRSCFSPQVVPLDIPLHAARMQREHPHLVSNARPIDPAVPIIGVYGKLGIAKGSYDLLRALARLKAEGRRFQLVALARSRNMDTYFRVLEELGLAASTWVLPFVPHWKVGRFIRACRAVCFLERDFPITFHAPTVPREVLASGTCLILSGEIASKQRFRERIIAGENALVVPDPKVHADLANALRLVIDDAALAASIGQKGAELLVDGREEQPAGRGYEPIFQDVLERRGGRPSTLPLADRGLPETREEALRTLVPALFEALGARAGAAVESFVSAHPSPGAGCFADAASFCEWVLNHQTQGDAQLRDVARYCERLVWLGTTRAEEERLPLYDRVDRWGADNRNAPIQAMLRLVPTRSNLLRIERFEVLPPGLPHGREGSGPGACIVVFHKQPNMNGHHFRVNTWTAGLLERCDGTKTAQALLDAEAARTGRPAEELERPLLEALQLFHQKGLIVLSAPDSSINVAFSHA